MLSRIFHGRSIPRSLPFLLFSLFLLAAAFPSDAAMVKLTPIGEGAGGGFGTAADISGGTILAGIPGDDDDGTDAGAAQVYIRVGSNWIPQARLRPNVTGSHRFFGAAVALADDRALVGAPRGDGRIPETGAAYLFQRVGTSWAQAAWLRAPDGRSGDEFGRAVSLVSGIAAAGAHRNGDRGPEAGAVHVFEEGTGGWTRTAKLTAEDGMPGDHFGWSLALDGERLAVGAPHRGRRGAVYVFRRSGGVWLREATLGAPAGAEGDFFGFSVALSGSTLLAGAPGNNGRGENAGAIFAFTNAGGSWTFSATLAPDSLRPWDRFGRSASLSGPWAAAGADGADDGGLSAGKGFLFRREATGWRLAAEALARDRMAGDRLGWPAAVFGDDFSCTAVFGARGDDDAGENAGAAYVLSHPSADGAAPDIRVTPRSLTLSNESGSIQTTNPDPLPDPPPPTSVEGSPTGLIIPESVRRYWAERTPPPRAPLRQTLPTRVDWSEFDSPVKSQGNCGSCSAFAAAALIENLMIRAGLPVPADVSEQTFLACAPLSCAGGWYWDALLYASEAGVPPEECYPYQAVTGSCFLRCANPEYLVKVGQFTPSPGLWGEDHTYNDLRVALQEGPLVAAMRVPADGTFAGNGYRGGVYNYNGGFIPWEGNGHAVLVVGYDDELQCFKAKNSWGAGWGENGYFRISYDDVADDVKFGSYACTASSVFLAGRMGAVTVSNQGGQPLQILDIRADRPWLEIFPNGGFSIPPGGTQAVTISVTDWDRVPIPEGLAAVTIESNDPDEARVVVSITARNFPGSPGDQPRLGDLDGRDGTTLADAVLGLRILAGGNGEGIRPDYAESGADVDGDGRAGFAEVLYILRTLGELPRGDFREQ